MRSRASLEMADMLPGKESEVANIGSQTMQQGLKARVLSSISKREVEIQRKMQRH